jgi:hypothetical protein
MNSSKFWVVITPFFSKGQPLSLNVVIYDIGNNLRIKGKVGKGGQKGLFELWLHE